MALKKNEKRNQPKVKRNNIAYLQENKCLGNREFRHLTRPSSGRDQRFFYKLEWPPTLIRSGLNHDLSLTNLKFEGK